MKKNIFHIIFLLLSFSLSAQKNCPECDKIKKQHTAQTTKYFSEKENKPSKEIKKYLLKKTRKIKLNSERMFARSNKRNKAFYNCFVWKD